MAFFKSKSNLFLALLALLLTAALGVSMFFVYQKHNDFISVSAELSENDLELQQSQKTIEELEREVSQYDAELKKSKKEKTKLSEQLAKAKAEKSRLDKENKALKSRLEELNAKNRKTQLQRQIAIKNANPDASQSRICYLTFDDGPSENTLKILDVLDNYGIKATFFVVGDAKTEYLPKIHSRGHAIGLHSATHNYKKIYASTDNFMEDIEKISDIVYKKVGIRSKIMRFPGGSSNIVSKEYCKGIMTKLTKKMTKLGYSYFDWNADSCDASGGYIYPSTLVKNVLNDAKGKDEICVLMHDNANKTNTVKALPNIIEGLDSMGFIFKPLTTSSKGFHQPIKN